MICPSCGTTLEKDTAYVTWCDCGYNVTVDPTPGTLAEQTRAYTQAHQYYTSYASGKGSVWRIVRDRILFLVITLLLLAGIVLAAAFAIYMIFGPTIVFVKVLGGLLALSAIYYVMPLFYIPRGRQSMRTRDVPGLSTWLDGERTDIHHVRIVPGYALWIERAVLRRARTLVIGWELLATLDEEMFTTALLRELAIDRQRGHSGLQWFLWTRDSLLKLWNVLSSEYSWTSRISANTRSRANPRGLAIVQGARYVLLPIMIIPYGIARWMNRSLPLAEQGQVYEANKIITRSSGTHRVQQLLQVLSLRSPVQFTVERNPSIRTLSALRDMIRQRIDQLPPREMERLLRTTREEDPARPLIHWQTSLLPEEATTQRRGLTHSEWDAMLAYLNQSPLP